MRKFKVLPLYFSGKRNKVHKAGEVLKLDEIPGGAENVEALIEAGKLEELESDDWRKTVKSIDAKAESVGFEFPDDVTLKDDKIAALEAHLAEGE